MKQWKNLITKELQPREILVMFAQKKARLPPQSDERMKKIAKNPDPNIFKRLENILTSRTHTKQ